MFPYRVKYTESEYDIQNINSLYKIDQKCQNTFEFLEKLGGMKNKDCKLVFLILYNFHNSYFVFFCKNCNFYTLCLFLTIGG